MPSHYLPESIKLTGVQISPIGCMFASFTVRDSLYGSDQFGRIWPF